MLRRKERRGEITDDEARTALAALRTLIDYRYEHHGWLATQAWDLRHAITLYDALYVALASRLGLPLVTTDDRLAGAPGLNCRLHRLTFD